MMHFYCLKLTDLKTVIEILAYLFAGFYFLWKVITGWLVMNLAITINTKREKTLKGDRENLAIEIILEKGNIDTLRIIDILLKISYKNHSEELRFPELKRFDNYTSASIIDLDLKRQSDDYITLSLNEKIQLGRVIEVPIGEPVFVEFALLGNRINLFFWKENFYWKSSSVSI